MRFRNEMDVAMDAIMRSPTAAGHILKHESKFIEHLRRRNLRSVPFFILYGYANDRLVFGSVIASRSDPLTWLSRFQ